MNKIYTNKRKKNFLNYKVNSLIFILFCCLFFIFINFDKILINSIKFIQIYSNKYNYNLENLEISNLKYLKKNEISNYFDNYKEKSIFLVPIKKISIDILNNNWVNDIKIKSNYKNSLKIILKEESPLGIYDNNNQKILFSKNLTILEILKNENKFKGLITFYGQNSINNSQKLLLDLKENFYENIESAYFIKNRRWNLQLKNKIILKLPEDNLNDAIKNYINIYSNIPNKDLKKIESIDLRIKKQAIIKYKND